MRVLLALCALLAACATQAPPKPAAGPSLAELASTLAIGRSTKSEVRAALGEGTVLSFDSDYEVWVYRQPSIELVLLFEPSGILSKTRLR